MLNSLGVSESTYNEFAKMFADTMAERSIEEADLLTEAESLADSGNGEDRVRYSGQGVKDSLNAKMLIADNLAHDNDSEYAGIWQAVRSRSLDEINNDLYNKLNDDAVAYAEVATRVREAYMSTTNPASVYAFNNGVSYFVSFDESGIPQVDIHNESRRISYESSRNGRKIPRIDTGEEIRNGRSVSMSPADSQGLLRSGRDGGDTGNYGNKDNRYGSENNSGIGRGKGTGDGDTVRSGNYNPLNSNSRYSSQTVVDPMYSKLNQVVAEYKGDKIGSAGLVSYLTGHGVKADEIRWSGIEQFLEGKKSVTKAELSKFLAGNKLNIKTLNSKDAYDAALSDYEEYRDWAMSDLTIYKGEDEISIYGSNETFYEYTLDENEDGDFVWIKNNITHGCEEGEFEAREEALEDAQEEIERIQDEYMNAYDAPSEPTDADMEASTEYSDYKAPGGENYREILFTLPKWDAYQSQHWDEKNVLAHARLQDFETDAGENVLFVDEVQSDWHQQGRDKGYGGDIPEAPFKDTWQQYVMKRILRMAAEGDYQYVAWTTGQMQIDRYDLSNKISKIAWDKQNDGMYKITVHDSDGSILDIPSEYKNISEVETVFGKDITRIIEADNAGSIDAGNITVGGEGMKAFYDIGGKSSQNIPRFMAKYVKPWGSRVQTIDLDMDGKQTVPAVKVTEAMKQDVLYKGQALFSQQEPTSTPSTRYSKAEADLSIALDLFENGVTLADYASDTEYSKGVADQLRGMYLRNGVRQGGALAEDEMAEIMKNAPYWENQTLQFATAPIRLFESLGMWRPGKDAKSRIANYNEGVKLRDTYWSCGQKKGAEKELWMAEQSKIIADIFGKDGTIRESTIYIIKYVFYAEKAPDCSGAFLHFLIRHLAARAG